MLGTIDVLNPTAISCRIDNIVIDFPGANDNIVKLNLSWNQIRSQGAAAIAAGLKVRRLFCSCSKIHLVYNTRTNSEDHFKCSVNFLLLIF